MSRRILEFLKDEIVLCVAFLLMVISSFIYTPRKKYIDYIDFRTLALLFCLMAVVAGLEKAGVFEKIANALLKHISNTRQLVSILVFLCFFLAMFITNDVALITFVPFCILILSKCGQQKLIIYTVVLQTIAANLGSMLMPIGNPQNLYLYNLSKMDFVEFILKMLPIWLVSFVLIIVALIPVKRDEISPLAAGNIKDLDAGKTNKATAKRRDILIYLLLFGFCLLTVANILEYYILFAIIVTVLLFMNRRLLLEIDYSLLINFICFFVFIGNMKNVPYISQKLQEIIKGREIFTGIVSSQVISNVPAAMLISGFTDNYKALMWGTNIGGLGTLIASMASLISYKIYTKTENHDTKKYFITFTGMNILFLGIMSIFVIIV